MTTHPGLAPLRRLLRRVAPQRGQDRMPQRGQDRMPQRGRDGKPQRAQDGKPQRGQHGMAERGSTIPLILGFFLVALLVVAGAVALGDAFVQQRSLQDICDGAAAATAASAADLDREAGVAGEGSLRFANVDDVLAAYLERDPERRGVHVNASLSPDRERITLICEQTTSVAFGALFGRSHVHHTATSSARAAVLG